LGYTLWGREKREKRVVLEERNHVEEAGYLAGLLFPPRPQPYRAL
jgi:hypothetical protein